MDRLKVGMQGATEEHQEKVQEQLNKMENDLEQKLREAAVQAEEDMQVTRRIMDKLKADVAQKETDIKQMETNLVECEQQVRFLAC